MMCRAPAFLVAISLVCIAALSGAAAAQTTQPAVVKVIEDDHLSAAAEATPPAAIVASLRTWPGVAQELVRTLSAGEVETAWALIAPRAKIDEFDPEAPATFARLADLAKRGTLLGVHPYETSPTTLAEDIAADVRDAVAVPDEVRRRITPRDEDEAARANATAAQWLAQNLLAEKGQPLAAVVLWDPVDLQVVFILLKGQKVGGLTAGFHVTNVVFGNPLVAPR